MWEQREKKTKTKKKEKRKRAGLSVWCSQENEIRRGLLGQPKSDKRRGQMGWDMWKAREENITPTFPLSQINFLHSHSLFYFSLHSHLTLLYKEYYHFAYVYIYIYIYISLPSQSYIHNIKIAYMFHNITISKLHALKVN